MSRQSLHPPPVLQSPRLWSLHSLQPTVYLMLFLCALQLVLHQLWRSLRQKLLLPPATVYQDNQAAIRLSENGVASSSRTRHIDIRYFFIQDRVENGDVKVEHLNTKSMVADYLTKPLVGELFYKLRDLLLGYTTL